MSKLTGCDMYDCAFALRHKRFFSLWSRHNLGKGDDAVEAATGGCGILAHTQIYFSRIHICIYICVCVCVCVCVRVYIDPDPDAEL